MSTAPLLFLSLQTTAGCHSKPPYTVSTHTHTQTYYQHHHCRTVTSVSFTKPLIPPQIWIINQSTFATLTAEALKFSGINISCHSPRWPHTHSTCNVRIYWVTNPIYTAELQTTLSIISRWVVVFNSSLLVGSIRWGKRPENILDIVIALSLVYEEEQCQYTTFHTWRHRNQCDFVSSQVTTTCLSVG